MLKGIDPLLGGDLLKILDDMGQGDELLIVDRNYPAAASGRPVIRLGEVSVTRAAKAILSVLPLDASLETPLERMEVDGNPQVVTAAQHELLAFAQMAHATPLTYGVVPRPTFLERAKSAFAIVHTLDDRPYGCFILTKGVVFV